MGKRHQSSRRRAYGRRQHEVRERSERPGRDRLTAAGIGVYEAGPFDEVVLTRSGRREPVSLHDSIAAPRAFARSPID